MARNISISDYTYVLPDEKIAKFPLAQRDLSKLLIYQNADIKESIFKNINQYLPQNSTLVFNNTKVVCARLIFERENATKPIEIFVLEPATNIPMEAAMLQKGKATWVCLVGNNRKFNTDFIEKRFTFEGNELFIKAYKPVIKGDSFEVSFEWNEDITFAEVLNFAGIIPLPPYLKRVPDENDKSRYQTVYAHHEGSVAAPTAGLHFTNEILSELKQSGHSIAELVLHVGAGTFKPVKAETMENHEMHSEEIAISKATLVHLIHHVNNIIAVGTTSLRTLESLFWFGLKLKLFPNEKLTKLDVKQWDAYDLEVPEGFRYADALNEIVAMMDRNNLQTLTGKTQVMIAPGYTIRAIKGIITNFHQPDSTLLLLIATVIGENWRKVYEYALENNFRFLSYGDSSLLLRD